LIALYNSPKILYNSLLFFNYCDVSSSLKQNETTFNATIGPLMFGFEDIFLPCLIKEEKNLYYFLPFSESFGKLEFYRELLTNLTIFDRSLLRSSAIKNLIKNVQ